MTTQLSTLYETDYFLWLEDTINQLKNRDFDSVDWDELIEELEGMSRSEKRKIESFLRQIFIHLLLYQYWVNQRPYNGNHWKGEIVNFRIQLKRNSTKTLYNHLINELESLYLEAQKIVVNKTGLSLITFPETCPYQLEQILDDKFNPDDLILSESSSQTD